MNPWAFRREFQQFQRCWGPAALREEARRAQKALASLESRGGERLNHWRCWLTFGEPTAQEFLHFAQEVWVFWRQSPSQEGAQECLEALEEALWRTPFEEAEPLWRRVAEVSEAFLEREPLPDGGLRALVARGPSPKEAPSLYRQLEARQGSLRLRAQWLLWERLTRLWGDEEEFAAVRERLLQALEGSFSEAPAFMEAQWRSYGRQVRSCFMRALFQPSRERVSSAREDDRRHWAALLAQLAVILEEESLWQEACHVAAALEDPCYAAEAWADCAVAAARGGWGDAAALLHRAQQHLARLRPSFDVVVQFHSLQAYRYVAASMAQVGAVEGSLEWVRKALRQAEAMSSGPTQARAVADCARVLEQLGTQEAGALLLRTLQWWQGVSHVHAAMPDLAEGLMALGLRWGQREWVETALQGVSFLRFPLNCEGMARCALQLAGEDAQRSEALFRRAAQLIEEVPSEHFQALAWREVLPRWARAGRRWNRPEWLREALALGRHVPLPGVRSEILAHILREWACWRPVEEAWLQEAEEARALLTYPRDVLPTECALALAWMEIRPRQGQRRLEEAFRQALHLPFSVEYRDEVLRECGRGLLHLPLPLFVEWFPRFWQALVPYQPPPLLLGFLAGPLRIHRENLQWPVEVLASKVEEMEEAFLARMRQREQRITGQRLRQTRWESP